MESPRRDLLRWQFDLAWSFFEYHLERLEAEDFLWEPGPLCWTLHAQADGSWVPDWAESQPDPIPVPTIAWTSWHLGWWLGAALDQANGGAPRDPSEVEYPGIGDAAIDWLRTLGSQWRSLLDEIEDEALDAPSSFPWPVEAERSLADMTGWVNAELMKNAAEIGTLRLLRASATRP